MYHVCIEIEQPTNECETEDFTMKEEKEVVTAIVHKDGKDTELKNEDLLKTLAKLELPPTQAKAVREKAMKIASRLGPAGTVEIVVTRTLVFDAQGIDDQTTSTPVGSVKDEKIDAALAELDL